MKTGLLFRAVVILCFVGAVGGCAVPKPAENIQDVGSLKNEMHSGSKSVVIGRIQWLEHGKEKKIGKGLFDFSVSPLLLRMEDRSRILGKVDEDGRFVWTLAPGIYVINRINYRDTWSGNYFMVPQVAFRVPEKGKAYYIGTLKADFASKRDFIGGLSGRVSVTIEDQSQRDDGIMAQDLGIASKDMEKSLMVHSKKIPRTIDTTPEFNMAMQILNTILFGMSQ